MFELLLIAQHLGSGGLQHPVRCGRVIKQLHQIVQQILQRNRRGAGSHPARGRQHRQVIDHVAHHLEGGRACPDDDPGPQLGEGDPRAAQHLGGQLPRAQVVGLLMLRCLQGAEEDDLFNRMFQ